MWPLDHLITTPLVRPATFGDRRFLTDEEFAAAQKRKQRTASLNRQTQPSRRPTQVLHRDSRR